MSYLVDTNVLSEAVRPMPNADVVRWLRENESDLYISTVTIGEIRRGIERLPDGERKNGLRAWLQEVCQRMRGRVLSFNTSTAHIWGQLKARWEREGIVLGSLDSQIAATAKRHGFVLVTGNEAEFGRAEVRLLNPFKPSPPSPS